MRSKLLVWTFAVVAAVSIGALDAGAQSAPADRQAAGSAQTASAASREFVNEMAVAGLAEVQLGKMATERAPSPDVKLFGQMMVNDHSRANTELTRIATQFGITPPRELDAKHKELADKLSKLKGPEFDREYMNAMVDGHEEVAKKLRAKAGDRLTSNTPASRETPAAGAPRGGDAKAGEVGTSGKGEQALSEWAAKTLRTVEKHLERAKELQAKVK
jgi:predicted outer membrane protein